MLSTMDTADLNKLRADLTGGSHNDFDFMNALGHVARCAVDEELAKRAAGPPTLPDDLPGAGLKPPAKPQKSEK